MEGKRDPFAQCAPTCLPKAVPISGVDENWTGKSAGQAGRQEERDRTWDWHGSLPLACRRPLAARVSICYTLPLVGSQEGKGTMITHSPLLRSYTGKCTAGPTCLGVNHTSIISQGFLGQTPHSNREWQSPSAKRHESWVQSSVTQPHGQWEGAGDASCHPSPVCWKLREPVLENCMLALSFFQKRAGLQMVRPIIQ